MSEDTKLREAEQRLADAKSAHELARGHGQLTRAISAVRASREPRYGMLAQTFIAQMKTWDAQKCDGVSREERIKGLQVALRDAWPQTREWKHLCRRCEDLGWVFQTCTAEHHCGRPFRLPGQHSDDHTGQGRCQEGHAFVSPCGCSKGQAFRRGLDKSKAPVDAEKDFAQAGKSKFTKLGR